MKHTGMSLIVKTTASLISGFVVVFAIYVALTGHLGPGGGFAGGVVLASAAVLLVLAFGRAATRKLVTDTKCHIADSAGAMTFLIIALMGYFTGRFTGSFFTNFVGTGRVHRLDSGGAIPLSNLAILVKVGAGLAGAFLALSAFHLVRRKTHGDEEDQTTGREE